MFPLRIWATTYFPTNTCSIIGAAGLNFSVRNGKRCAPAPLPPEIFRAFTLTTAQNKTIKFTNLFDNLRTSLK